MDIGQRLSKHHNEQQNVGRLQLKYVANISYPKSSLQSYLFPGFETIKKTVKGVLCSASEGL